MSQEHFSLDFFVFMLYIVYVMRPIIIAGPRDYVPDTSVIADVVSRFELEFDLVITGGARGVDTVADNYAKIHGIDRIIVPANWNKYGKRAGYIRNEQMAMIAENLGWFSSSLPRLLVIRNKRSPGTDMMIAIAQKHNFNLSIEDVT